MIRPLGVGLTGGIASGKTTVSELFRKLGATIIDADDIARECVAPSQPALREIVAHFGHGILMPSGELDRAALRKLVFASPDQRQRLEEILHPPIWEEITRRRNNAQSPYVIISVPLLIETHTQNRVDRVLVIDCPAALQRQRLLTRANMTDALAEQILAAQATRETRLSYADDVILNDGNLTQLEQHVRSLHIKYLSPGIIRRN